MSFEKRILAGGNATLYCGDSLHLLPSLPQADCVLTDPPYASGGMYRSDRMMAVADKYGQAKEWRAFAGDNKDQRSWMAWCSEWLQRLPNGWRCRCRVVGVTQREYDAGHYKERPGAQDDTAASLVERPMKKGRPKADGDTVEWQNPQTGEVQQVPRGIDPGFAYNAGTPKARSKAFDALVQRKLEAMRKRLGIRTA